MPNPFVSPFFRPGWDDWLGWEDSNRFFHTQYSVGTMPWPEDVPEMTLPGYQTDAIADFTIQWLKARPPTSPGFT